MHDDLLFRIGLALLMIAGVCAAFELATLAGGR